MFLDPLLLFTSLVAGVLTILAPCVLPLLPVIVGGAAGTRNKWYPFILVASLSTSVILFTILLKASTLFIDIPQSFWKIASGGIVVLFGLIWLFPHQWEAIQAKTNILGRSQMGLSKARKVESNWGAVLMGAALGPVFSSCSPTYFVILATVLPVSFLSGLIYLMVYGFGLAIMLGLIAFFGQKITSKLGWAAKSDGWFKRGLGALLIVVGLAVVTGFDKKVETWVLDAGFGVTNFEQNLLDSMEDEERAPVETKNEDVTGLPQLFEAPELVGLENWINSEPISSMEELKGKVVLVDFWTYSCINCIRTLPYLQSWHEKYEDDGLVILAIHAPEFQFEQKFENVQKAVEDFGLTYPVVQDNDFKTWRAYKNRYWPAKYLIDKQGVVRYTHFGEGAYEETEQIIVDLLETKMVKSDVDAQSVDFNQIGTRETYIGNARRENYIENAEAELKKNEWTLGGQWTVDDEKAVSQEPGASIRMNFTAAVANLVIGGVGNATVLVDGAKVNTQDVNDGKLIVNGERLYELANFNDIYEEHEIEIIFDEANVEIFAWTFG